MEKLSQLLTLAMHCFLPSIPALPASRAVFWCVLNSSGTHDPAQNSGLSVPEYNTAENLTHPPESMIKIPMRKGYTTAKLRNVFFAYGLSCKLSEHTSERHYCSSYRPRSYARHGISTSSKQSLGLALEFSAATLA